MRVYPQFIIWTYILLPAICLFLTPAFFYGLVKAQQQKFKIIANALNAKARTAAALAKHQARMHEFKNRFSNAADHKFKLRNKRNVEILERKSNWDQQEESLGQLENMWNMNMNNNMMNGEILRREADEGLLGSPRIFDKRTYKDGPESYAGAFFGRNVYDDALTRAAGPEENELARSHKKKFKKFKKKGHDYTYYSNGYYRNAEGPLREEIPQKDMLLNEPNLMSVHVMPVQMQDLQFETHDDHMDARLRTPNPEVSFYDPNLMAEEARSHKKFTKNIGQPNKYYSRNFYERNNEEIRPQEFVMEPMSEARSSENDQESRKNSNILRSNGYYDGDYGSSYGSYDSNYGKPSKNHKKFDLFNKKFDLFDYDKTSYYDSDPYSYGKTIYKFDPFWLYKKTAEQLTDLKRKLEYDTKSFFKPVKIYSLPHTPVVDYIDDYSGGYNDKYDSGYKAGYINNPSNGGYIGGYKKAEEKSANPDPSLHSHSFTHSHTFTHHTDLDKKKHLIPFHKAEAHSKAFSFKHGGLSKADSQSISHGYQPNIIEETNSQGYGMSQAAAVQAAAQANHYNNHAGNYYDSQPQGFNGHSNAQANAHAEGYNGHSNAQAAAQAQSFNGHSIAQAAAQSNSNNFNHGSSAQAASQSFNNGAQASSSAQASSGVHAPQFFQVLAPSNFVNARSTDGNSQPKQDTGFVVPNSQNMPLIDTVTDKNNRFPRSRSFGDGQSILQGMNLASSIVHASLDNPLVHQNSNKPVNSEENVEDALDLASGIVDSSLKFKTNSDNLNKQESAKDVTFKGMSSISDIVNRSLRNKRDLPVINENNGQIFEENIQEGLGFATTPTTTEPNILGAISKIDPDYKKQDFLNKNQYKNNTKWDNEPINFDDEMIEMINPDDPEFTTTNAPFEVDKTAIKEWGHEENAANDNITIIVHPKQEDEEFYEKLQNKNDTSTIQPIIEKVASLVEPNKTISNLTKDEVENVQFSIPDEEILGSPHNNSDPLASIEKEMSSLTEEQKEAFIQQEIALIAEVIKETLSNDTHAELKIDQTTEKLQDVVPLPETKQNETEKVSTPHLFQAIKIDRDHHVPYDRRARAASPVGDAFDEIVGAHREKLRTIQSEANQDNDLLLISLIGEGIIKDLENSRREVEEKARNSRVKRTFNQLNPNFISMERLVNDPKIKIDIPKTLDNVGGVVRYTFEDPRAPMYHVRNLLGNTKNTVMAAVKVAPNNILLPTQYEVSKLISEDVAAINPETLNSRSDLENADPFGIIDTFQQIGGVVKESVNNGKEVVKHANEVATDARNAYYTVKNSRPLSQIPVMASRSSSGQAPALFMSPRVLDVVGVTQKPAPKQFVGMGNILDAIGVSKPNQPDFETKFTPRHFIDPLEDQVKENSKHFLNKMHQNTKEPLSLNKDYKIEKKSTNTLNGTPVKITSRFQNVDSNERVPSSSEDKLSGLMSEVSLKQKNEDTKSKTTRQFSEFRKPTEYAIFPLNLNITIPVDGELKPIDLRSFLPFKTEAEEVIVGQKNEETNSTGRISMTINEQFQKPFLGLIGHDKVHKFLNEHYDNNLPENGEHYDYYPQDYYSIKNVVYSEENDNNYNMW